ncbi:MAG: cytochrome c [Planctomycetes bacterium]|nr:cytochrome c [Planctomycetota bacterium]
MNRKPSLLAILLLCACSPSDPATTETTGGAAENHAPIPLESDNLAHLLDLGSDLYSGSMPPTAASFEEIAAMGVKMVVNVDSASPAVELAEAAGMTYVHIPIGYDGVPEEAALALERVIRDAEGPIYFHCHHGKHRGPAAAAIALRAASGCSAEAAAEVLSAAGTSEDYKGLWRDVAAWQPAAEGVVLPELVSVAKVADFPAGMAKLDRVWDRVKLIRKNKWQIPADHPDLALGQETLILTQLLRESSSLLSAEHQEDREFQRQMEESTELAHELHQAARQAELDLELLDERYLDLAASCKNCHRDYRND